MAETTAVQRIDGQAVDAAVLEQVLATGNIGALSVQQRVQYYGAVCEKLGLNPLTRPFQFLQLNGKTVLYATRDCTDQLRSNRTISTRIIARERVEDVWVVTAQAQTPAGRVDESIGAVTIAGLKGDALANALMKTETKAKRRVTLSICGLGFTDESELETIPGAKPIEATETHEALVARRIAEVSAKGAVRSQDAQAAPPAAPFEATDADLPVPLGGTETEAERRERHLHEVLAKVLPGKTDIFDTLREQLIVVRGDDQGTLLYEQTLSEFTGKDGEPVRPNKLDFQNLKMAKAAATRLVEAVWYSLAEKSAE